MPLTWSQAAAEAAEQKADQRGEADHAAAKQKRHAKAAKVAARLKKERERTEKAGRAEALRLVLEAAGTYTPAVDAGNQVIFKLTFCACGTKKKSAFDCE